MTTNQESREQEVVTAALTRYARLRDLLERACRDYRAVCDELHQPRAEGQGWYEYGQETDRLYAEAEQLMNLRWDLRAEIRRLGR